MEKKYRYNLCQSADGITTGTLDLTKEEAEFAAYVMNCSNWSNLEYEDFSGSCHIDLENPEEIEDDTIKSRIVNKVVDENYIQWIEKFVDTVLLLAEISYEEVIIKSVEQSKRIFLFVDGQDYIIRTWNFIPFNHDEDEKTNAETVVYTLYMSVEDKEGSYGEEIHSGNALIEWENE